VDFALTDEQSLLVETAQALFSRECPASVVRASSAGDDGGALDLFERHLRDWVPLGVGPLVDLHLFLVEAGAAVVPGPFLATAGLFVPLLDAVGHELATVASSGDATGTVAIAGIDGAWSACDDPVRRQVVDAHLVERVAVIGGRPEAPTMMVVFADSFPCRRVDTLDGARGTFDAEVPPDVGGDPIDPAALAGAIERMTVAVAAEMVGVARWAVDTATAYAKERVQFGRPIGSFQAVQHKLVNAALAYEQAAAAVAYAAMAIDADDPDRHRATHVAKAEAGAAARGATRDALQVLGGVGFTWEHDLHLRLRRAYADDALLGTRSWHLDRLSDLLFATS
jgi:Acyl-CoA dehydrogenase, C-terminal domain